MLEKPDNNTNDQVQSTWDFVKSFLETPPTSSIFRLYLLSFIIWNKGVILYILFGNADMADKLLVANFGKYILHFCEVSEWQTFFSMYTGPLIVCYIICFAVFKKFKILEGNSIYYFLSFKNHIAEINFRKIKSEQIDVSIETANRVKKIYENMPKPESNFEWIAEYMNFKNTVFYKLFGGYLTITFYDLNGSVFDAIKVENKNEACVGVRKYLYRNQCLESVYKQSEDDGLLMLKYTSKGLYFIKCYEFEKKEGLVY